MKNYDIKCPHCGGALEVQDDWAGLETTCPLCNNSFVIPRRKNAPVRRPSSSSSFPPPVQRYTQSSQPTGRNSRSPRETFKTKNESGSTNKRLFIVLGVCVTLVVIAVAVLAVVMCFVFGLVSDELPAEKVAGEIESKEMTKLFANSDYLYHGVAVKKVNLTKEKDKERSYRGEVVFARGDRQFKRPISVSYTKEGELINYSYEIDCNYSKHPEFLKEDADMLFDRLKAQVNMKEWKVVSAENLSPGIVRCSVQKGAEQGDVDIKVQYKNDRFHYVIVNIQGVPQWEYEIGMRYFEGKYGVEKNRAEAVVHFRRAAEKGHVAAQHKLGRCYWKGDGVAEDFPEAAKWFRKAAEQGNPESQFNLGLFYANGWGVAKDFSEAVKWYRMAAEQGISGAQLNLGFFYANGWGVAKDFAAAVEWFLKAAEQGEAQAQHNLGLCYIKGWGVAKNMTEAVKWFRKAAERGHAGAQFNLGLCHFNGWGVAEDFPEAVKWYRKAAGQGFTDAQFNLGLCYFEGRGVGQNRFESVRLFRIVAARDYAPAQYMLGLCYANGWGVAKNDAEAIAWLRKAAGQGFAQAQNTLRKMNSSW